MAFSVDQKVRVVDQSSEYRRRRGVVQSVSGDDHEVRLDGHGCHQKVTLRTDQMQSDSTTHSIDYSLCTG